MAKILFFATLLVFLTIIVNSHQATTMLKGVPSKVADSELSQDDDCPGQVDCGRGRCCPVAFPRYSNPKPSSYGLSTDSTKINRLEHHIGSLY